MTAETLIAARLKSITPPGTLRFLKGQDGGIAKTAIRTTNQLQGLEQALKTNPTEILLFENQGDYEIETLLQTVRRCGASSLCRILVA